MLKNTHLWILSYIRQRCSIYFQNAFDKNIPSSLLFSICDHFEPYWENYSHSIAYQRVKRWMDCYQPISASHKDCIGNPPKHSFFYPIEEYQKNLIEMVAEICRNGFGETEIHLHHHNDNSENLKKNLINFKNILSDEHGLLSKECDRSTIRYGFIHGDWALDNSSPDGACCGVNNEISILKETGCYADFTMPSAPSDTQTKTINSIYYAIDDPEKPKSHNTGKLSVAGKKNQPGLLCIQGPLGFNSKSRKFGIIPRIENGNLSVDMPITMDRIRIWVNSRISVSRRKNIIFVKLYTHGTQDKIMKWFFDQGALNELFNQLEAYCNTNKIRLFYVSARQMYNVVKGLENDFNANPENLLNYKLKLLS